MMTADKESNPFDEYYFQRGCGRPYERDEEWLNFFASIADRIVNDFQPRTVLDAGCAKGFLVEALRERGVEAYGLDISDYAISSVHENVKDFCWVGSVTDPLPMEYDLIVCIEVLEHMEKAESETAIRNLCTSSKDILFSSTPFDYKEATHFNVQPPEYWAEAFAKQGYIRDMDFDASFITAWAVRFLKREKILRPRVVREYERSFYPLWKQNIDLRNLINEMRQELVENQGSIDGLNRVKIENLEKLELLEKKIVGQQNSVVTLESELKEMIQEQQEFINQLELKNQRIESLTGDLIEFEKTTRELRGLLDETHHKNVSLKSEIKDQEIMNKSLTVEVEEKNRWLEKESNFSKGEIALRDNKIYELSSIVAEMMSSNSWRMTDPLRRFMAGLRKRGIIPRKRQEFFSNTTAKSFEKEDFHRGTVDVEEFQNLDRPPLKPHSKNVDLIICVHNALDYVRRCLESVILHTTLPYQLIIVNDGSDADTSMYLENFSKSHDALLIINSEALGYTRAANQGLQEGSGDFSVLLNSDTIVTPEWLDRMCACIESDPRIGIIGPLSNTASWQSIPELFENNDWATNSLEDGYSIDQMAQTVAKYSGRLFPKMKLLNGFCLMIKRQVLDTIGFFDEENFGEGYGEEDDFTLRARAQGWELALADDVYIFHEQSMSYSDEKRIHLTSRAIKTLAEKHGQDIIDQSCEESINSFVLEGIRARSKVSQERDEIIRRGQVEFSGKRIIFALPVAMPGGGANVVFSEAKAMAAMGVDVRIFNLNANRESFQTSYPSIDLPVSFGNEDQFARLAELYDAAVATVYFTVDWLKLIKLNNNLPVLGYYIQGFEPLIFPQNDPEYEHALRSYTLIPDNVCFTKTNWTQEQVLSNTGVQCHQIGASIDIDLYRPRDTERRKNNPIVVSAMIRPSSSYRKPAFTMKVLEKISRMYTSNVEIKIFGASFEDPEFMKLAIGFPWKSAGILSPKEIAGFFNQTDIFVDFSSHQAMGLAALEAMACGNAVIVPENGGVQAYGRDGENCLIVDTSSAENCLGALMRIIDDRELREQLQKSALRDVVGYYPERPAFEILKVLFSS